MFKRRVIQLYRIKKGICSNNVSNKRKEKKKKLNWRKKKDRETFCALTDFPYDNYFLMRHVLNYMFLITYLVLVTVLRIVLLFCFFLFYGYFLFSFSFFINCRLAPLFFFLQFASFSFLPFSSFSFFFFFLYFFFFFNGISFWIDFNFVCNYFLWWPHYH